MLKKDLEAKLEEMLARIDVLEKTVFALKENVKEQKQQKSFAKARKWLNSYPDETEGN
jgi:Holliday junction resolvase-like predicted endonuclease